MILWKFGTASWIANWHLEARFRCCNTHTYSKRLRKFRPSLYKKNPSIFLIVSSRCASARHVGDLRLNCHRVKNILQNVISKSSFWLIVFRIPFWILEKNNLINFMENICAYRSFLRHFSKGWQELWNINGSYVTYMEKNYFKNPWCSFVTTHHHSNL